jgi:hypothetical protein
MSLRDELQRIYDQHGELTPELVVDTARPKSHPLHSHLEWSDRVAGEAWRRHQAAELIRSVKVTYREATESEDAASVRMYHAVRGPNGHAYKSTDDVVADPFTRQLVLRDMEREWKALKRRYEHFAEFLEMITADLKERESA